MFNKPPSHSRPHFPKAGTFVILFCDLARFNLRSGSWRKLLFKKATKSNDPQDPQNTNGVSCLVCGLLSL